MIGDYLIMMTRKMLNFIFDFFTVLIVLIKRV